MINHLSAQKNLTKQRLPVHSHTETSWQAQMADTINDLDELLAILQLADIKSDLYIPQNFPLRVPRAFVNKMHIGDANDPLLLQVLPQQQELKAVTGYVADPLAENVHNPIQGLLHKYQSRVLITVTGACGIHCRYCFRQHFDYQKNIPTTKQLTAVEEYIKSHPEINEVILSGGDPLSVSNRRLIQQLQVFADLEQIHTIRLHTRLPIVIPERLDAVLLKYLAQSRCQIVIVLHCNHANEIDGHTEYYIKQAKQAGITLLNQAVLLQGINDSVDAQVALSRRLFAADVLPYYLHVLDKVAGAAHFDIAEKKAVELYWQMLAILPGYLMPKLVREEPHRPFKTPINLYKAY